MQQDKNEALLASHSSTAEAILSKAKYAKACLVRSEQYAAK